MELAIVAVIEEVVMGAVLTLVTFGISVSVSVSAGETRGVVVTAVGTIAEVVGTTRFDVLVASGVVVGVVTIAGVVAATVLDVPAIGVAEETATTPDETATCRFSSCLASIPT